MNKLLSLLLLCAFGFSGAAYAADSKASAPASKEAGVSESEYARWLVNVLGLSRSLPASPSDKQCFESLLQNGISPKKGWNPTNLVSWATLSRTVVQAMKKQGEIKNPDDDKAWMDYLAKSNIEFGKIKEALDQLQQLDPLYGADAIVISTDALSKKARIRPLDDDQLGSDMQTIRKIYDLTGLGPVSSN